MKPNDVFKFETICNLTVYDHSFAYFSHHVTVKPTPSVMTPAQILGATWVVVMVSGAFFSQKFAIARHLTSRKWVFFTTEKNSGSYGTITLLAPSMPLVPGSDKRLHTPMPKNVRLKPGEAKVPEGWINIMFRAIYERGGLGLSANQIGCHRRMFIMDVGGVPRIFIEPVLESAEGEQYNREGCLTFPEELITIKRAMKVTISGVELEGLEAAVAQHELDHLDGKTILDYA
jgi:peptide deformylase